MTNEKDTTTPGPAAASPGDGLPDDVEAADAGPARPVADGPSGDGVPEGLSPEEEAVAEAVAAEDAAEAGADAAPSASGEADADGDVPAVEAEPVEEPDWHDRYLRAAAELENVRRRARRDIAAGEDRGVGRLARELLPALDDVERAVAHLDETGAPTGTGEGASEEEHLGAAVRTVHQQLVRALGKVGIEQDRPEGEAFDPHRHEALSQQPAPEGVEPGTIVVVYQAGYRRGDDVLRAAKVVVAG